MQARAYWRAVGVNPNIPGLKVYRPAANDEPRPCAYRGMASNPTARHLPARAPGPRRIFPAARFLIVHRALATTPKTMLVTTAASEGLVAGGVGQKDIHGFFRGT
jgi:hypothetical protein